MYTVVKANEKLMQLYQNVIHGGPDCWDVVSNHRVKASAMAAAKRLSKHYRCQVRDAQGQVIAWGCDL